MQDLVSSAERFKISDIPVDSSWNNLEYLKKKEPFVIDSENFNELLFREQIK
jgi:alpha-glucosidase (family GH31 glycosyl hydrolase)